MKKLGFIGFGEAAYNMAVGLKEEGLEGILAYDKYWNENPNSELITKRAAEAGVELISSMEELVTRTDFICSAVSANMSIPLAQEAKPFLTKDKVYVDMNATSPMTKEEVDKLLSSVCTVVDCAIMGPVPNYRHKVPMSVSGDGAKLFAETMAPYNMNITLMNAPAGGASGSKMFRSIYMKGFVMLVLEMLVAAHKYQVEDDVMESVNKTMTSGPILDVINGLVTRGVIHSERREHEMEEVLATLEAINADSIMSKSTKDKLHWCTGLGLKKHFDGVPPKDYHAVLEAMDQLGK